MPLQHYSCASIGERGHTEVGHDDSAAKQEGKTQMQPPQTSSQARGLAHDACLLEEA